jgi:hypothetical protein
MSPANGVNAVEWLYNDVIFQRIQNACQKDPRYFDRVRFRFDEFLDFKLFQDFVVECEQVLQLAFTESRLRYRYVTYDVMELLKNITSNFETS